MTNGEMFRTAEELMSCPFCGSKCVITKSVTFKFYCECISNCMYASGKYESIVDAIAAHNRVCKAVKAYNESEVNNG